MSYPPPPDPTDAYPPPDAQPVVVIPTTSAAAIAALVTGLLGLCVPVVGGLASIVLAIVGLAKTRRPGVEGRGMAVAGLVLGILTTLGWGGVGGFFTWLVVHAAPDRAAARQFLLDVSAGNATAAQADCVPGVAAATIDQTIAAVKPWGPLTDTTFFGVHTSARSGQQTITVVSGSAVYGTTARTATITLVHDPVTDQPLVQQWAIR